MIGDLHIHSRYSSDSMMKPKKIVKIAKSKGFDTIAITDHNTIQGGIEAKRYEDRFGMKVIVGSEINTDVGDLIGLQLEREIESKAWRDVIIEIKEQGGIVVLPHPYRDHICIEELAGNVDLIEIWNARCSPEQNQKAMDLAIDFNCNAAMGSDAHLYSELGNVCVRMNPATLAIEEEFPGKYATVHEIRLSQIIGYMRQKEFIELLSKGGRFLWKKITC